MSSLRNQTQSAAAFQPPHALLSPSYTLSSELAKLCLPSASKDENRRVAWANSICFLFLVIGLVGLKARQEIPRTLEEPVEIVPVVFTPPVEPPKIEPELIDKEPDPTQDVRMEAPQIATVVAADPAAVNFPVQVEGPVVFAPARFAAAPPPSPPKPPTRPRPTVFNASGAGQGLYPDPPYPSLALRRRYQGKLLLFVIVDPNGSPASVQVKESSGYPILDEHSSDWVKNRWRWPPGETRHYLVPIQYKLEN